jgi:hypothetical protein
VIEGGKDNAALAQQNPSNAFTPQLFVPLAKTWTEFIWFLFSGGRERNHVNKQQTQHCTQNTYNFFKGHPGFYYKIHQS